MDIFHSPRGDLRISTWEFENFHVGNRSDRRDGGRCLQIMGKGGRQPSMISFEASDLR